MNLKKITIRKVIVMAIAFALVILLIGCKQNATSENTPSKEIPPKYSPLEIKPSWQPSSSHISIVPRQPHPDGTETPCFIKLDGQIDSNTAGNLAFIYNSATDQGCKETLYINSLGGDVDGAMKAGEFIRQKEMDVIVLGGESCASSCVLLLLGGVKRFAGGKIGLHRPYSTSYSETDSEAKNKYESINLSIRSYLKRMNIPDRLLEEMNAIPPNEIKWLYGTNRSDQVKLVELHIEGKDPIYLDRVSSLKAKELGISKQEFYARKSKEQAICTSDKINPDGRMSLSETFEMMGKCSDDVMAGRR